MKIYDIVRIVGPSTCTSFPINSRTLVDHYDSFEIADARCADSNLHVGVTREDYHYEVEEHDECSPKRAMPVGFDPEDE